MGDMGDMWKSVKKQRQWERDNFGKPCPECQRLLPKAHPSILVPGQSCRIHDYRDPRDRSIMQRKGEGND